MEPSDQQPDRGDSCQAVWRRLVGLFGADSVQRKFGKSPPPEWGAVIGNLPHHELERGMRRLVHSGRAHVPTLPEFLRLCREVGGTGDFDEGPRPAPFPPAQQLAGESQNPWVTAGNGHLLAYVLAMTPAKPRGRYHGHKAVRWLLASRNAWAEDMAEFARSGTPPEDHGRKLWRECMETAETGIDSGEECI